MAGSVLQFNDVVYEDQLGCAIGERFLEWNNYRTTKIQQWDEVRRYIFATDTRTTTNNKLPWKNTTTLPKLCQIRDNLQANYQAAAFPSRKWLTYEASSKKDQDPEKKDAIINFMKYVLSQRNFKDEMRKLILDYIDYGNCFATVDWRDDTQELEDRLQVGYVGPEIKRISPLDIVFNPTADSFERSPKIVRSIVSMGEVKEILERFTTSENHEEYEKLWTYLQEYRSIVTAHQGELNMAQKDAYYQVDGFHSFRAYLESDYVELLTFYGDIYNRETEEFLKNHMIMVVDRHKVIAKKPNPSYFGYPPIFHAGWRVRQDNLWAMGPLENLVGMQYRLDHIENLKADVFDLVAFPPLMVKGYVEPFEWGPFARINVGDDGDVKIMSPDVNALQANIEIAAIEARMEEIAGSPKEAMGFRTPGEKTAYEVQRLENAASRTFQQKITQFEEQFIEPLLNAMLEVSRRNMTGPVQIRVFDDELKAASFMSLTPDDITGSGTIRPLAARHFAERAELLQNWNNFYSSGMAQDQLVTVHLSGLALAKMLEEVFDSQEYGIVIPYVRPSEQAELARLSNTHEEQVLMESQTASGLTPDDHDIGAPAAQ